MRTVYRFWSLVGSRSSILIFIFDSILVSLCDLEAKKLTVMSSANTTNNAFKMFMKDFYEFIKSLIVKKTKRVTINDDHLKRILYQCDQQFNGSGGGEEAVIKVYDDVNEINVKKSEVESLAETYTQTVYNLMTELLTKHKIPLKKIHIYHTYPQFMRNLFSKHLNNEKVELVYCPENNNAIFNLTKMVSLND